MNKKLFYGTYFIIFFAQAISYCLLIAFLLSLGYSATQRGLFFVVEAVFGMLLQSLLGYLCDRYRKIKIFWYLSLLIYFAFTTLLYRTRKANFWLHIFLVMGVGSSMRTVNGLLDSITIETDEECREKFGTIRAFGSVGWALGSPVTALLVEKFGYASLGFYFGLTLIILVLVSWKIRDVNKSVNRVRVTVKEVRSLFANRYYVAATVILFIFFIVDTTQSYGVIDKILALKGTETEIGYYWTLAALLELPLFFATNSIARKLGKYRLLTVAGLLFVFRYILYGSVSSIFGMFVGGAMQALTYPVLIVLSKELIDEQSPEHLKTSGQQVSMSIYGSGSALLSPLLVGLLEDGMGIDSTLYVIALLAAIATFLSYRQARKEKLPQQLTL